jgi:hypothetical protein
MSTPVTAAPVRAATSATPPVPQARSRKRSPRCGAICSTIRWWTGANASAIRS